MKSSVSLIAVSTWLLMIGHTRNVTAAPTTPNRSDRGRGSWTQSYFVGRAAVILAAALLTRPPIARAQAPSFADGEFYPVDVATLAVQGFIVVDLNNDGALDVPTITSEFPESDAIRVLLNDGTGRFGDPLVHTIGDFQVVDISTQLTRGDLNGDTRMDLAYAVLSLEEPAGSRVFATFGNGDGTFADDVALSEALATSFGPVVAAGDMDGDDDLDLVVSDPDIVLLNDGAGSFPTSITYPGRGCSVVSVILADLEGDDDLDIVTTHSSITCGTATTELAVNNGDGTFEAGQSFPNSSNTLLADFDDDGDQDLVILPTFPGTGLRAFENQDLIFVATGVFAAGEEPRNGDAGDLNGDGLIDLVVTLGREEGEVLHGVLLGNGDVTFGDLLPIDSPRPGPVRIADIGRDGLNDLVVRDTTLFPDGGNPGGITVLLNTTPVTSHGDVDGDGDVDLDDYAVFFDCMEGPEAAPVPTAPVTEGQCLAAFDFNEDSAVDLEDFAAFAEAFSGG